MHPCWAACCLSPATPPPLQLASLLGLKSFSLQCGMYLLNIVLCFLFIIEKADELSIFCFSLTHTQIYKYMLNQRKLLFHCSEWTAFVASPAYTIPFGKRHLPSHMPEFLSFPGGFMLIHDIFDYFNLLWTLSVRYSNLITLWFNMHYSNYFWTHFWSSHLFASRKYEAEASFHLETESVLMFSSIMARNTWIVNISMWKY